MFVLRTGGAAGLRSPRPKVMGSGASRPQRVRAGPPFFLPYPDTPLGLVAAHPVGVADQGHEFAPGGGVGAEGA